MVHENVLDQFDLAGSVALVTGAGSGIGRAYTTGLSQAGAAVACLDVDGDRAESTAASLDGPALAVEADVTDEDEVDAAVDHTVEELGGLDAVFPNAGIGGAREPFYDLSLADWRAVLDVNLTGVFLTARAAARAMMDAGTAGRIVSTASIYGFVGSYTGTAPAYAASKGGVTNLTREMAVALLPHGIRVNAIAPGFVSTDLADDAIGTLSETAVAERDEALGRRTLSDRPADPAALMGTAVFLASPAASYLTGQTIPVDGGWLAR
ncbi:SDR family NAD(P)-dependent oxidoreductase [Halomarina litorea]|uniref:SDR family NAD(P)-dependent oxidoreductase n=1 Tax=Halomarina litorea TaxID=2961595 RepID=UPI0020C35311|nr:SDR family oxidoreductase [Halomarina sp. BCD28]